MKLCNGCNLYKPRNKFSRKGGNSSSGAVASKCKTCCNRRKQLRKMGWNNELYKQVLNEQLGRCKICDCILTDGGLKQLDSANADHDHQTGKPRGILCGGCNKGLGFFSRRSDSA